MLSNFGVRLRRLGQPEVERPSINAGETKRVVVHTNPDSAHRVGTGMIHAYVPVDGNVSHGVRKLFDSQEWSSL
jgi:hypothetical protein